MLIEEESNQIKSILQQKSSHRTVTSHMYTVTQIQSQTDPYTKKSICHILAKNCALSTGKLSLEHLLRNHEVK